MKNLAALVAVVAVLASACGAEDTESTTTVAASPSTTEGASTTVAETTSTVAQTTTTAPETTSTTVLPDIPTTPVVPGEDEHADVIVEVYAVAFDSTSTFDQTAPLIDDPTGLEATVEAYNAAGEGIGGIFLQVTETGVEGDEASVVYDLLFGGNPFQTDQAGFAVRNDGTWQVTRAYSCSIVELARVPCS